MNEDLPENRPEDRQELINQANYEAEISQDKPLRLPSYDGIYPRCVYCNGEIYGPAVIDYSRGKALCYHCSRKLPSSYVSLKEEI